MMGMFIGWLVVSRVRTGCGRSTPSAARAGAAAEAEAVVAEAGGEAAGASFESKKACIQQHTKHTEGKG